LAEEAAKKRLEAEAEAARLKHETEIALAESLRLKKEAEDHFGKPPPRGKGANF
jgi:hypothetical protein